MTLTFRCGSDQNIEQALKAISNIIGDQIVDYTMVPDGRKKERGRQILKTHRKSYDIILS